MGKLDIMQTVAIPLDALLGAFESLSETDKVLLIIELDERAASWDVTLPLCEHFAKARANYAEEHRSDYPHGCLNEHCADCKPPSPSTPTPPPPGSTEK